MSQRRSRADMPAGEWVRAAAARLNRDPAQTSVQVAAQCDLLREAAARLSAWDGLGATADDHTELAERLARIERTVRVYRETERWLAEALDGLGAIRPNIEAMEQLLAVARGDVAGE